MNQQEATIAVWRAMHQQMTDNFAAASVECQLLREQVKALRDEVDKLNKPKEVPKKKSAP